MDSDYDSDISSDSTEKNHEFQNPLSFFLFIYSCFLNSLIFLRLP